MKKATRKPGRPKKVVEEKPAAVVPKKNGRGRKPDPNRDALRSLCSKQKLGYGKPRRKNKDGDHFRRNVKGRTLVVREYVRQNGVTRPHPTWSDGTPKVTYRVWEIADRISKEQGRPAEAKEVSRALVKLNEELPLADRVGAWVFNNEFYRWRRFNGIQGRKVKGKRGLQPQTSLGKAKNLVATTEPGERQTEMAFSALPPVEATETPAPRLCEPAVSPEPAAVEPPAPPVKPPPPVKPAPPAFLKKPAPPKPALPWAVA